MHDRILCAVLIAAIIACPMSCANGMCHADRCCSKEDSANRACSVHRTVACRCKERAVDDHRCPYSNHGPCRCPAKACQGVCGGAVFDKPVELNGASDSLFLPLVDANKLLTPQRSEARALEVDRRWHSRGVNYGRLLRTLRMSFLC